MYNKISVLLKAGPRLSGPRLTTQRSGGTRPATAPWPGVPEARQPGGRVLIFHSFFCPAVNPRACTDLHRVWACKMDDGEFEFVYHFNNHFNPFRSFLSVHVAK